MGWLKNVREESQAQRRQLDFFENTINRNLIEQSGKLPAGVDPKNAPQWMLDLVNDPVVQANVLQRKAREAETKIAIIQDQAERAAEAAQKRLKDLQAAPARIQEASERLAKAQATLKMLEVQ